MNKKAFTLIEIIMAMAIMTIGIIAVVRILPLGLRASKSAEMMSRGAFLAQEKMEELKLAGVAGVTAPEPVIPLEGEEKGYIWATEVSEVPLEGVTSSENIRRLTLTVSWQEKGKTRSQDFITYIGR
jgi:prepilin-type N-terminal cleavage/methylation domain-containing protein